MVSKESFSLPFEETSGNLDADHGGLDVSSQRGYDSTAHYLGEVARRNIINGYGAVKSVPRDGLEEPEEHAARLRSILDD